VLAVPAALSFIVTIDGPAGTGKSTVAHLLAKRLGLEFLDTGAMYRAAALEALDRGIDLSDGVLVADLVRGLELAFDWKSDPPELFANGRPVGERIRTPEVTRAVSKVASNADVRAEMVRAQRSIARRHPRLVTEGRDQGSVVFPDADVRIYLDARPDVRARRRVEQLALKGIAASESEVLAQIIERDRTDSTRADGPLVCPGGAIVVDTSDIEVPDVIERLEDVVRTRAGEALAASARSPRGRHASGGGAADGGVHRA
jgi:CMP/dCMP kinase